jgi:hypothetical protein
LSLHCKKDYLQSKNCPEFICFGHENINSWALKPIFQAIEWKYYVNYHSTPLADIFHPVETYFPGHTLEMLQVLFQAIDQQFLLQGWKNTLYMVELRCCIFSPQDGTEQTFL